MGFRFNSYHTATAANSLPANATETVIFYVPPLSLPVDSCAVIFLWQLNIRAGTGTTALTVTLRRGPNTSGTAVGVGTWKETVTATQYYNLAGVYFDVFFAAQSDYCLTIAQTGASAAGTLGLSSISAFVL